MDTESMLNQDEYVDALQSLSCFSLRFFAFFAPLR